MINIKNFDPNKIETEEKSYENILAFHIRHVTVKNLSYTKFNSVNPL